MSEAAASQATTSVSEQALALAELMFPTLVPCLHVAAELDLAELLAEGPLTADELAERTDTHAPTLRKVLSRLAEDEIFADLGGGRFGNTPRSEFLRREVPGSLNAMAHLIGNDWLWNCWGRLDHNVRTGRPAFDAVYGTSTWPWLQQHPQDAAEFDRAMAEFSSVMAESLVRHYPDFGWRESIADLGGGNGTFLAAILAEHPTVKRGVIADLPHVIARAMVGPEAERVFSDKRIETFPGDFLVAVPEGVACYVTKQVMHSWDDEKVLTLLRLCREASPQASFVAAELVQFDGASKFAQDFNLVMSVTMSGSIRTAEEYGVLFEKAGYRLTRVIPTGTAFSIVEAFPAR